MLFNCMETGCPSWTVDADGSPCCGPHGHVLSSLERCPEGRWPVDPFGLPPCALRKLPLWGGAILNCPRLCSPWVGATANGPPPCFDCPDTEVSSGAVQDLNHPADALA